MCAFSLRVTERMKESVLLQPSVNSYVRQALHPVSLSYIIDAGFCYRAGSLCVDLPVCTCKSLPLGQQSLTSAVLHRGWSPPADALSPFSPPPLVLSLPPFFPTHVSPPPPPPQFLPSLRFSLADVLCTMWEGIPLFSAMKA